ncbi:hypothetical protein Scep_012068 [Stephania cephalantha]|uniref:Uncharacterized protein n=1 Tax=Stephania cephalantha TaxID=152367 RepID=A0AAP0JGG2_9MAGN
MVTWVTVHGGYDLAYLLKLLLMNYANNKSPESLDNFYHLLRRFFGRFYDVKPMTKFCDGLFRGLDKIAPTLQIKIVVGNCHYVGSDSLLTWQDNSPPPELSDGETRSTKKVRNQELAHDIGREDGGFNVSFRETLMRSECEMEPSPLLGDIKITLDEVQWSVVNNVDHINFSERVRNLMVHSIRNIFMVKLLGRSIGYKILTDKHMNLWRPIEGMRITDMDKELYMVCPLRPCKRPLSFEAEGEDGATNNSNPNR